MNSQASARRRSQMSSPRTAGLDQALEPNYTTPYASGPNGTPPVQVNVTPSNGNTGYTGGRDVIGGPLETVQGPPLAASPGWTPTPPQVGGNQSTPTAPPTAPDSSKVDYTKLGQFAGSMGPWNAGNEKFQRPWDQMSERYKMLTIQSHFDPRQGVTQELVDALNNANINGAKFSLGGSPDRLNATGLQNWRNYDGREGIGDIVQGFKTGNGTWAPWQPEGPSAPSAPAPGGAGGMGLPAYLGSSLGLSPTPSTPGGGGNYTSEIMRMLAQQLGLGQALGGGQ
jgi:hypothetical protein